MIKILSILLVIFASVANASTTNIDVLNSYRVGGSFHRSAVSLNEHNPTFNEPINLNSCSEVIHYLDQTDEPTIAIWDYMSHELSGRCDVKDYYITTYVSAYYNICTLNDNNIEDLIEGGKVGVADWYTVKTAARETLKGMGSNSKVIPYSTSRDYLLALEIGEIDYVYTHKPKENMKCIMSNDPNGDVPYTGDFYDGPFKNFSSDISIIGTNVNNDEVRSLITDSATNSEFVEIFPYYKHDFGLLPKEDQLREYDKMLEEFE